MDSFIRDLRRHSIASQVTSKPPKRFHRVLVVDDDSDTARMFVELLLTMGHEARYASDSSEAIPVAFAFRPDIALLDLGMPALDGYALARILRSTPGLDAVHLVAVSGHGEPEDRMRARQAGFDAHVTKPADIALLESILAQFDCTTREVALSAPERKRTYRQDLRRLGPKPPAEPAYLGATGCRVRSEASAVQGACRCR